MDFEPSARSKDYLERVRRFMREHLEPAETRYREQLHASAQGGDWRTWPPRMPPTCRRRRSSKGTRSSSTAASGGRAAWATPWAKIAIFMAHTPDAGGGRHHQHSMVLVPLDAPGVEIQRMR